VAIGGGTGLSTLLKGLKQYVPTFGTASNQSFPVTFVHDWHIIHLSAVVTVSDDGGSSGRLRKDFNMLPPGDIRNCIVALSEDEALLSKLFQHRFVKGTSLEGHSFGNLFLAALTSITGDFSEAVRLSSEILATRGHIYPATNSNLELEASGLNHDRAGLAFHQPHSKSSGEGNCGRDCALFSGEGLRVQSDDSGEREYWANGGGPHQGTQPARAGQDFRLRVAEFIACPAGFVGEVCR
jgi:2-phospho-L-lactate transferase/gluconeogenesis factor (CofD/UPF0052 family)